MRSVYYNIFPLTLYFQVKLIKLLCTANDKNTIKHASERNNFQQNERNIYLSKNKILWWYRKEKTNSKRKISWDKRINKKVNGKYLYLKTEKLKITYDKMSYNENPTVILAKKIQSTYYIKEGYKKR